jgi:hypothetical protein
MTSGNECAKIAETETGGKYGKANYPGDRG